MNMHEIFVLLQQCAMITGFLTVIALAAQRACEEQKYLLLASCSAWLGSFGYLLVLISRQESAAVLGLKMGRVGNCFCIFMLVLFILAFIRNNINKTAVTILVFVTSFRCALICVSGIPQAGLLGKFYFTEIIQKVTEKELTFCVRHGVGYYIGCCIDSMMILYCIGVGLKRFLHMTQEERRGILWIVYGGCIVLILMLANAGGAFGDYDILPVSLTFLCLLITLAGWNNGVFRMQYFAQSNLIQRMEQGIIVVDSYFNLLQYNALAARLFHELQELEVGDKITDCTSLMELFDTTIRHDFQSGECYYKAQVTSMMDKQKVCGYIVWIYDMTETKNYTDELIRLKEKADHSNREKSNFLANMSHEIRTPMNVIIGSTELILREQASDTVLENAATIKQAGHNLLGIINDILDFSKIEAGKMEITPVDYSMDMLLSDMVNMTIVRLGSKPLQLIVDVDPEVPKSLHGDDIRIKQIMINLLTNAMKFTEKGYIKLTVKPVRRFVQGNKDIVVLRFEVEDSGIGIKEENQRSLFDSFSRFDTVKNRAVEGTGLGLAISLMLAHNMNGQLQVESEYGRGSCFSLELPQEISPVREPQKGSCYKKALILEKNEAYADIFATCFKCYKQPFDMVRSEEQFFERLTKEHDILFVNKEVYNSPLVTGLRVDKVVLLDKQETAKKHSEEDLLVMKQMLGVKLGAVLNQTYFRELRSGSAASEQAFTAPEAKILIVDDNAVNLKIATGLLRPFQLQVEVADSGRKAIELVEKKDYDLVFMDHMMPEMDGVETTARIRSKVGPKYQQLVIIALTANAVNGAKNIFLSSGMQDFLSKPIEMDKLTQVLKRWLPKDKIIEKRDSRSIELNGFSMEEGLAGCENDEKKYQIALRVYLMMTERFMEEITVIMQRSDWEHLSGVIETFGAESKRVGAIRFSSFLEKYRQACEQHNEKFIVNNYTFLKKSYSDLTAAIKGYIGM